MQVPVGFAIYQFAITAVRASIIGAAAGGVIIGLCYKGYRDGKKRSGK